MLYIHQNDKIKLQTQIFFNTSSQSSLATQVVVACCLLKCISSVLGTFPIIAGAKAGHTSEAGYELLLADLPVV